MMLEMNRRNGFHERCQKVLVYNDRDKHIHIKSNVRGEFRGKLGIIVTIHACDGNITNNTRISVKINGVASIRATTVKNIVAIQPNSEYFAFDHFLSPPVTTSFDTLSNKEYNYIFNEIPLPFHDDKGVCDDHKNFVLDWIKALNSRAAAESAKATRSALACLFTPPPAEPPEKRLRMSHTKPTLPAHRFHGLPSSHLLVPADRQSGCTYCKYVKAKAKLEGLPHVDRINRPKKKCSVCGDHLCKECFESFHSADVDE